MLAHGEHPAGHGEHEQKDGAGGPAGPAGQLPADERRPEPAAPGGDPPAEARRERQQPQHQQGAGAQGQRRRRDQQQVDAEPGRRPLRVRRRAVAAVPGHLPVGEDGEGQQRQVGSGAGGPGDDRLPAAGPAQHGGRGPAEYGGQGDHQQAGHGTRSRGRPQQQRVAVRVERHPGQRADPGEQPQQRRGEQRGQQRGRQGDQQRLGQAQGGEPPAGRPAGQQQDPLALLPVRQQAGDEQQGGRGEDGELQRADEYGRPGHELPGFQFAQEFLQFGGGGQARGALEAGGGVRGTGGEGPRLGGADVREVGGDQPGAGVLDDAARGEGAVVDEQRAVRGEGADLDLAPAERVQPPVGRVPVGRPVDTGDPHGERCAAVPVVQPYVARQRLRGEPQPGQRLLRDGDRHGAAGRRHGAGPPARDEDGPFAVEGGQQGQGRLGALVVRARQPVRAAARRAFDSDRKPPEQLAAEGAHGRVVLPARGHRMPAGDEDGAPDPVGTGQGLA